MSIKSLLTVAAVVAARGVMALPFVGGEDVGDEKDVTIQAIQWLAITSNHKAGVVCEVSRRLGVKFQGEYCLRTIVVSSRVPGLISCVTTTAYTFDGKYSIAIVRSISDTLFILHNGSSVSTLSIRIHVWCSVRLPLVCCFVWRVANI